MPTITAALVLGFIIALGFSALFHLIFGGSSAQLLAYILLSVVGFWLGHLLGQWLNITLPYSVYNGTVHLITASIGAWVLLFFGRWLMADG